MKTNLNRAGAFSFALILLLTSIPGAVSAADSSTSSYGRISSTVSSKIRELDDDIVEKFPIPVLMGLPLSRITPDFGDPRGGGTREHEGQDFIAPRGSYVVSPTEAVVTRTGTGESSGKYVSTANPGGERFVYMHLDAIADGVRSGKVLKKGDLIGYVGDTGNAKGGVTHLHFEVRDGREALDPYPRLSGEFSLKERIEALGNIVKDADDEKEEGALIVANYRATLISARAQGIELSDELEEALGTIVGTLLTGSSQSFTRDLTLGSQGGDVISLQSFMIAQNLGPAGDALAAAGATGYFGSITQAALIAYQTKQGISPALGYFGPLTRTRILSLI